MASEMSITQNFRQLTKTLPVDSVTVNIDIKMLNGQYTYLLNNNYTDVIYSMEWRPWTFWNIFENSERDTNHAQFLLLGNGNESKFG